MRPFFLYISDRIVVCLDCSTIFKLGHHTHTPDLCKGLGNSYDNHIKRSYDDINGGILCPLHPNQHTFRGRICCQCHPNVTILGLRTSELQHYKKKETPNYTFIYAISNGQLQQHQHLGGRATTGEEIAQPNYPTVEELGDETIKARWKYIDLEAAAAAAETAETAAAETAETAAEEETEETAAEEETAETAAEEETAETAEEQRQQQPLLVNSEDVRPFLSFQLRDPENYIPPHLFIGEHIQEICKEINESHTAANNLTSLHFKLWIWCTNYYGRKVSEGEGGGSDVPSNTTTSATTTTTNHNKNNNDIEIMHSNTHAFTMHRISHPEELIIPSILEMANNDLGDRFCKNRDALQQSGWSFLRATDLKINLVAFSGRTIKCTPTFKRQATRRLARSQQGPIQAFKKYPVGFRGTSSLINVNYTKLIKKARDDVLGHDIRKSPCVKYALKSHFLYNNKHLHNRSRVLKGLMGT